MSIMANVASKKVSKPTMEKYGLFRYAASKGKTRIEIEYDSDSGTGWMNVFVEDYEYASHSESPEGIYETQHKRMEKADNWIMVNLPEICPSISVSFKREIAEMQVEKFGAIPLYGLDNHKAEQLPVEIFITCGGILAPDQRRRGA